MDREWHQRERDHETRPKLSNVCYKAVVIALVSRQQLIVSNFNACQVSCDNGVCTLYSVRIKKSIYATHLLVIGVHGM